MDALKKNNQQAWIHSAFFDLSLILGPPLFASLLVLFFRQSLESISPMGPMMWLLLIVFIDVGHVYSSIFRTYLDPNMQQKQLLWQVPLFCWVTGFVLYLFGAAIFWTALAYTAVYHFIRQQYGFMMIYSREEKNLPNLFRQMDRIVIYLATFYPLLYWHTHLPRQFNWFIEGDFIPFSLPIVCHVLGWIYVFALAIYVLKELWILYQVKYLNIPKNLILLATAATWYLGIVWMNNDLAFTLTNSFSHGIPYVALIWIYGKKNQKKISAKTVATKFSIFDFEMIPVYIGTLLLLAYFEEGLWDGFVWKDHESLFPIFTHLPKIQNHYILAALVPLLVLPQTTHYIFDAYIWRIRGKNISWKDYFFKK